MLHELAIKLDNAALNADSIEQLSAQTPLSLTDAYRVQALSIEQRLARGEQLVGYKMGFTSRAKMEQMGVDDLIFGRLTDAMIVEQGQCITLNEYVHPRAEPEIAFKLKAPLSGVVTKQQALDAIEAIAPAIEIIDSRYRNFKFSLADVIADNCSSSGFIIGQWRDAKTDISQLQMDLLIDGKVCESGDSRAILDHPLNSLIEAARCIGEFGEELKPGQIILAGAATAAVALQPGTHVSVEVETLGSCGFYTGFDMNFENSAQYAQNMDANDPLASYRDQFHQPQINDKPVLYFTGNSLGLAPKAAKEYVNEELDQWAKWGVEGHFHAKNPWVSYHELLTPQSAHIVGANESEVVCMGSLTNNLHLLFVSFYQPTAQRFKIIAEAKMFPSDRYLLETQVRHHGFDPDTAIIEVAPRKGKHLIEEQDIIDTIKQHGDEVALVFFGGVNYFTGQVFDMQKITHAAHQVGAYAGFDLAHAAGNIELHLHDWQVDFAAWCTYKYLNASPGNTAALFVHERHGNNTSINRFGGWWGHDKQRRFLMEPSFQPMQGAEGWQLSNAPVMGMAILKASLDMFDQVGMPALRNKSLKLTSYLEFVFNDIVSQFDTVALEIITPTDINKRGCQLSVKLVGTDKTFFDALTNQGVICDFREPDVIRLSPTPLYNSFSDIYQFGQVLKELLLSWQENEGNYHG
ncbi:kynureninase [Thalassotalea ponticola]|uniref:kynureninase n=1 Tax=Thalassotalea ponticola TaxID=1523392 RepID=UPI0025B5878E|nr:kynureninase [Thalassotalea ponticola]MDN3653334.1 kynureninase [Thalassotalea ponticola]